jgi:predicted lipoprotein
MKHMSLLFLLAALCGCGDAAPPYDRNAMLTAVADEVVVPTHEAFVQRSAALAQEAKALCAAPDAAKLERTRGAWWDARAELERGEAFGIGPWRTLGLAALLDRWPTDAAQIEALVAGDAALDAQGLAVVGANKRGFPALEYLLWGETELEAGGRRCELVVVLAEDISRLAGEQLAGWEGEGGFAVQLGSAGRVEGMYKDPQEALAELVNAVISELEMVVSTQLGKPLGADAGGVAQPTLAECWRSDRSLAVVRANLEGARALYEGAPGSIGIGDMVQQRNAATDKRMREAFAAVFVALDAVPGELDEALTASPTEVAAVQEAVRVVLRLWKTEVVSALSVTLTFNDNDGD